MSTGITGTWPREWSTCNDAYCCNVQFFELAGAGPALAVETDSVAGSNKPQMSRRLSINAASLEDAADTRNIPVRDKTLFYTLVY
jgi:hypothetical protein